MLKKFNTRSRPLCAVALLLSSCALSGCGASSNQKAKAELQGDGLAGVSGRVIGLAGNPVAGARVETPQGSTTTDAQGRFTTPPASGPRWVTVSHAGYVKRARVGLPGSELLVRLTDDPKGEVVTLAFGGDTMFGRRFYDPNEDHRSDDGLVKPGTEKRDFPTFLSDVGPFLSLPDLTALNFESVLLDDERVYLFQSLSRNKVYHPTKAFTYASKPLALDALKSAGVDVLGLANNHTYDALEEGVTATVRSLSQLKFPIGTGSFGVGPNDEVAWRPAVTTARAKNGKELRVAYLGCTTITGREHPIDYVANPAKGGAASCDIARVKSAVKRAKETSDLVVFMVHGGEEYERTPTEFVQAVTQAAVSSGALLVVNHHPHVVSGFTRPAPGALVAWSMGNFLFDQTVWPTFESYMLFVQYKGGKLLRAYVEPIVIGGYEPHPVAGAMADYVASGAAGRLGGDHIMENGAVELVPTARVQKQGRAARAFRFEKGGTAVLENAGAVPRTASRVGRDLLWVGRFENEILGMGAAGGPLWTFEGPDREISKRYASEGAFGAGLWREKSDPLDIVLTTQHRFPIAPQRDITVVGRARTTGNLSLELSWYHDTKGASYRRAEYKDFVPRDGKWHDFRIDVSTPPDLVDPKLVVVAGDDVENPAIVKAKPAFAVYFRLKPQGDKRSAGLDDLRIIEWSPKGTRATLEHTHSLQPFDADVQLVRGCLPGGC